MKAVRLKSSGQSVGRRMIYGGKDLWNRCVLSLEWKLLVVLFNCNKYFAQLIFRSNSTGLVERETIHFNIRELLLTQ